MWTFWLLSAISEHTFLELHMLAVMQTSLKQFFLQSVSITCALDIYYVRQPSIWRKLILRLSLETLSMRQSAISPFSWPLGHILHHHCSASNESQISKKSHSLFKHILIGKRAAGVCGDCKFRCCVAAATTLVATFVCCELSQSQSNKVFIPPPPLHFYL